MLCRVGWIRGEEIRDALNNFLFIVCNFTYMIQNYRQK